MTTATRALAPGTRARIQDDPENSFVPTGLYARYHQGALVTVLGATTLLFSRVTPESTVWILLDTPVPDKAISWQGCRTDMERLGVPRFEGCRAFVCALRFLVPLDDDDNVVIP